MSNFSTRMFHINWINSYHYLFFLIELCIFKSPIMRMSSYFLAARLKVLESSLKKYVRIRSYCGPYFSTPHFSLFSPNAGTTDRINSNMDTFHTVIIVVWRSINVSCELNLLRYHDFQINHYSYLC